MRIIFLIACLLAICAAEQLPPFVSAPTTRKQAAPFTLPIVTAEISSNFSLLPSSKNYSSLDCYVQRGKAVSGAVRAIAGKTPTLAIGFRCVSLVNGSEQIVVKLFDVAGNLIRRLSHDTDPLIFPPANSSMPPLIIATQEKDGPLASPQSEYFIGVGSTMSLWLFDGLNFFAIAHNTLPGTENADYITDIFISSNRTFALAATDSRLYLVAIPTLTVVSSVVLSGSFNPLCHASKTAVWVRADETSVSVLPRFGCQLLTVTINKSWSTQPNQMSLSVSRSAEFDPSIVGFAKAIWGQSPNMSNPLQDEYTVAAITSTPQIGTNTTTLTFSRFNSTLFDVSQSAPAILSFDQRDISDNVFSADSYFPEWNGEFFANCLSLIAFDYPSFNATAALDLSSAFRNLVNNTGLYNHSCAFYIGSYPVASSALTGPDMLRSFFSFGGYVVSYDLPSPATWALRNRQVDTEGWLIIVILGSMLLIITLLLLFIIIVHGIAGRKDSGWDSLSD